MASDQQPTAATKTRWLDIARSVQSLPTAPMMEAHPSRHIERFVKRRKDLVLTKDAAGNLLVRYHPKRLKDAAPLVMVAHLDHPGWAVRSIDGKDIDLEFRGGVLAEHVKPGRKISFFTESSTKECGKGKIVEVDPSSGRLASGRARLTSGTVKRNGFAMWDFPDFTVRSGTIVSRVCDDLLGAAAALCVLDEVRGSKDVAVPVWALFTRAEEIGLIGCLAAIDEGYIPKNASILSLECSKALSNARQGDGVIVRVGDASSIFDPMLSQSLREAAMRLRAADPSFDFQRKLMDGGTCEATAFCATGYRASGLALPLANYHNMGIDRHGAPTIGAESVKAKDFFGEVRLLIELCRATPVEGASKAYAGSWKLAASKAASRLAQA